MVLDDSEAPFFKWFTDGTLNVSYNCLDRHLDTIGDKVAYHWIGEPGDTRTITYRELYEEVTRFANALKWLGVERGDRVAIYLGMIPELPIAMLACARIGAIHSVVFGGFSSDALASRINDAESKVVITQDGAWRRGRSSRSRRTPTWPLVRCPSIEHVVVVRRAQQRGLDDRRARPLVPRDHRRAADSLRAGGDGRRGSCSTSSTRPVPPASRRASCTPRAAT